MPNPDAWIFNADQGYESTARSLIFPSPFFPKVFWYLSDKSNSRRVNQETIHYESRECTGSSHWAKYSITHTKQYPFPILLQCNNHQGAWELLRAIISFPLSVTIFISEAACMTAHWLTVFLMVHPLNHAYSSAKIYIASAKSPWFLQFWGTKTPWVLICPPETFLKDCQRVNET